MTIFQLKELAVTEACTVRRRMFAGTTTGMELLVDGVIHAIGVGGGLIAAIVLIVVACYFATAADVAAVSVYAAGLITMLALVRDVQSVSGVALEMDPAPLRSFRDLCADRRDLYAVHRADDDERHLGGADGRACGASPSSASC